MKHKIILLFLMLTSFVGSSSAWDNLYYSELSLKGQWKFSIGDNMEWARVDYNDSDWEEIYAPRKLEEEGYRGYNGFAWYRIEITVPQNFENRDIFLELGYIDDVDEVYFNGNKIGQSGTFPPHFCTAYNSFRKYQVPLNLVNIGAKNTIAVRVYDAQLEGGIVGGDLKIAAGNIAVRPDISLNGKWNFNLGREVKKNTTLIQVPGAWENNGFYNYDGYAVYSKTVNIPENLARQKLIFMAGRIDDDDQLYINNQFIGETGNYNEDYNTDMHYEFRNYFIPEGIIKPGDNQVVIKVVDRGGEGGIQEGDIGFITQENFIKYWRLKREK